MAVDLVSQTIESGVEPIQIEYHPIRDLLTNQINGYRTVAKINSISLGILYPQQYRVVTNRNSQCIRLAKRVFTQLEKDVPNMIATGQLPPFITVYVPTKMLMRGHLENHLQVMKRRGFDIFSRICLEFSADLLMEDTEEVCKILTQLQQVYGFKFALGEFGDAFCPIMRISGLPLQYVFLDESVSEEQYMLTNEMQMLIQMLTSSNIAPIIENTDDEKIIKLATNIKCRYYVDINQIEIQEAKI